MESIIGYCVWCQYCQVKILSHLSISFILFLSFIMSSTLVKFAPSWLARIFFWMLGRRLGGRSLTRGLTEENVMMWCTVRHRNSWYGTPGRMCSSYAHSKYWHYIFRLGCTTNPCIQLYNRVYKIASDAPSPPFPANADVTARHARRRESSHPTVYEVSAAVCVVLAVKHQSPVATEGKMAKYWKVVYTLRQTILSF